MSSKASKRAWQKSLTGNCISQRLKVSLVGSEIKAKNPLRNNYAAGIK